MKINEVLSLTKIVRERLNDLKALRTQVAVKDKWMREPEKVTEPQYDVKEVDKKIIALQNFLFEADSKIKATNAITDVHNMKEIKASDLLESL
jgi:hypothetical protein